VRLLWAARTQTGSVPRVAREAAGGPGFRNPALRIADLETASKSAERQMPGRAAS